MPTTLTLFLRFAGSYSDAIRMGDIPKGGVMVHRALVRPLVLLSSIVILGNGCGFVFTSGPPQGHEQMDYFTCTESNVGPALDGVWAGLNLAGAIIIASDQDAYIDPGPAIAGGILWGVFSTAAMIVGTNKTKKCREAKRLLAQRQGSGVVPTPQSADATVVSVVIRPTQSVLDVDDELQLSATAYNSSGVVVPGAAFVWSSSNDAIASVSSSGLVSAHAAGNVVIAARTANVVGTARIEVQAGGM